MSDPQAAAAQPVSFANDISPIFQQFRGQMMWRFDLTSYDAVKANCVVIYGRIKGKTMPPPPFEPLSDEQIAMFGDWIAQNFPR